MEKEGGSRARQSLSLKNSLQKIPKSPKKMHKSLLKARAKDTRKEVLRRPKKSRIPMAAWSPINIRAG